MSARRKVTVVGAGNVGATCAQVLALRDYADVVLVDIKEGLPQGKALDINQMGAVLGYEPNVVGSNGYDESAGSSVVVITAGLPRSPGMSRDDLGAGGFLIAVRADDGRLVPEHCAHLVDVEGLPLRQVLFDVDEHDLRVVARREHLSAGRADVAGAHHSDLASHTRAPIESMIASATSLVPTAVGSSREAFMSYVT